jgi:hypothetical protein
MIKPDDPDYELAKKLIETPKVVFTKTLRKSQWLNITLATGDLTDEITKLKSESGKISSWRDNKTEKLTLLIT